MQKFTFDTKTNQFVISYNCKLPSILKNRKFEIDYILDLILFTCNWNFNFLLKQSLYTMHVCMRHSCRIRIANTHLQCTATIAHVCVRLVLRITHCVQCCEHCTVIAWVEFILYNFFSVVVHNSVSYAFEG